MSSEVIVETRNLSKVYRDFWGRQKVRALKALDLEIRRGDWEIETYPSFNRPHPSIGNAFISVFSFAAGEHGPHECESGVCTRVADPAKRPLAD